jgi:hypothetical protein
LEELPRASEGAVRLLRAAWGMEGLRDIGRLYGAVVRFRRLRVTVEGHEGCVGRRGDKRVSAVAQDCFRPFGASGACKGQWRGAGGPEGCGGLQGAVGALKICNKPLGPQGAARG